MSPKNPAGIRVISFPPSADSEVGRWVLHHYGIEFDEERNTVPFILVAVGLHGGSKFPLFLSETLNISGARAIVDYFELIVSPERKLVPKGRENDIAKAWQDYNATLGSAMVTWAYTHLLPLKAIMIRPLSLGTPAYQRFMVRYLYWLPKTFLWRSLKLSPEAAAAAEPVIRKTFEDVSDKLADGRRYLLGDRFSIADLLFAVAGAPVVLPQGYGGYQNKPGPIPTFDQFPKDAQALIQEVSATEAGKFILRIYQKERYRSPT